MGQSKKTYLGASSSVVGPHPTNKSTGFTDCGNDYRSTSATVGPFHIFVNAAWGIIADMVKIFWKVDDGYGSLERQEYFELRLDVFSTNRKSRFLIREIHAAWSDRVRQVTWNRFEDDNCHTPEEAQRCYDNRRAAILTKGFKSSAEMEFSEAS